MLSLVNQDIFKECALSFYSTNIDSVEKSLNTWSIEKERLFFMFGNRLKFSVDMVLPNDFFYSTVFNATQKNGDFRAKIICNLEIRSDDIAKVYSICSTAALTNGIIQKNEEFVSEDGKVLKIPSGMKTMKAIRKIIEFFNGYDMMDDFVQFRDAVSVARTFVGKEVSITFSIDPVDFLIMSENKSGWQTCYSKGGSHHQSPIGWMNSPYAVLAYIEDKSSNSKMTLNDHMLPNMNWREIFLVGEEFIVSGISYPFMSDRLTTECLDILAEALSLNVTESIDLLDDTLIQMFDQSDDFVYNDWKHNHPSDFYARTSGQVIEFVYLDRPTCLLCGKHMDDEYNESSEIYGCCSHCISNNCVDGIIYPDQDIVEVIEKCDGPIRTTMAILESDYICLRPGVYQLKPMLR